MCHGFGSLVLVDPLRVGFEVFAAVCGIGGIVEGLMYVTLGRGIFRWPRNAPAPRPRLRGLSFLVLSPTLLIQAISEAQSPDHVNFILVGLNVMLGAVGVGLLLVSRHRA